MIEKLTELDWAMIDSYRRYHTREEWMGNVEYCDIKALFDLYEQNKQTLYKMLGKNFILEKPFEIEKSPENFGREIEKAVNNCNGKLRNFIDYFKRSVEAVWTTKMGKRKNLNDENEPYVSLYYDLLCASSVQSNTVDWNKSSLEVISPKDGSVIVINKGMKLMKAIQKIVDAFEMDQARFEEFRIAHSQLLNDKKLKGTLCLSIHPLDYMTMSDNTCDWGSCMSWRDVGCYRRGTVEMMNSPYVVVAYLKSDKDMKLFSTYSSVSPEAKEYEWNNKKWRELFIIHENVITGIKGYPYTSRPIETEVIKWLRDLAHFNLGREYSDNIYEYRYNNAVFFSENDPNQFSGAIAGRSVRTTFTTYDMYNDFGCTPDCKHLGVFSITETSDIQINYSGESVCMCCGFQGVSGCESYLLCEDCGHESQTCDCCGYRGDGEDFHWVDDECICQACYEDETYYDTISGEDHWNSNQITIALSLVPDRYVGKVEDLNDAEEWVWRQVEKEIPMLYGAETDFTYIEMLTAKEAWEYYPNSWAHHFKCSVPNYDSVNKQYWISLADLAVPHETLSNGFDIYGNNVARLIEFNKKIMGSTIEN